MHCVLLCIIVYLEVYYIKQGSFENVIYDILSRLIRPAQCKLHIYVQRLLVRIYAFL